MQNLLHERLKPVATLLNTLIPVARTRAITALAEMRVTPSSSKDTYARCLRTALRELLLDSDLNQYGWAVTGNSNSLHLFDRQTGLTIRFLKAFDQTGSIPPAGSNNARKRAWTQTPLLTPQNTADDTPQSLWGLELVCTWTEDDERITCHIQQPTSTGQWPERAGSKTIMTLSHTIDHGDLDNISFNNTESDAYETVEEKLSTPIKPQQTRTRSNTQ